MSNKRKAKAVDAQLADVMREDTGRFEYWLMTNWKLIVSAMVLLLVAIGVYVTSQVISHRSRTAAADALVAAADEEQLLQALQKYGSAPSAVPARLRLARIYVTEKRYEDAAEQFRLLKNSDTSSDFKERIGLEEAYMHENAGKIAEAAKIFAEMGRGLTAAAAVRAEANYAAGRLYAKLGEKDQAIQALQKSTVLAAELAQSSNSQWCFLAQSLLIRLENNAAPAPEKKPEPTS